jgi:hypothetical protein
MLGILVGAACLYALVRTLRGGTWAYAHGPWMGRGWGGGWRHGEQRGWHGERHRGHSRGMLRWLFERMDTSPGQEKVLASAADALRATVDGWRDDLAQMRTDVARSIRSESFDGSALDEAFARVDIRISTLRDTLRTQAARVHEALEPRQRAELAELLASGPRRRWNA